LHLAHHEYGRSNCYKYPHLGDWQQQKLTKAGATWEVPLLAVEVSGDRKLTQISEATYVLNMISSIHLQLSASCLLPTPIVVGMSCQKHFRQEDPFTGASGQGGGVTEICFHLVRKNARRGSSRLLENEGTRQTATPVLLKNCLPEGLCWHCKLALSRSNGCGAQAGSSTKAAESFVPNCYDATECCQRVL